jgi:hypothetical protein
MRGRRRWENCLGRQSLTLRELVFRLNKLIGLGDDLVPLTELIVRSAQGKGKKQKQSQSQRRPLYRFCV